MFIIHLALGGCLKAPPIRFGLTSDTGGHIAYLLDAALHQARSPKVAKVSIVTRLFQDPSLGPDYAIPAQPIAPAVAIDRIATANRAYLEKEALAADLPAFTRAFCAHLATRPALPAIIHAHFSDAARVAAEARRRFGIPFVYTPHALGMDKRHTLAPSPALQRRIRAEARAIHAADAIIVSTRDEAERQVAAYGTKGRAVRLRCIPPGVPQAALQPGPTDMPHALRHWLHHPAKPIILAIARPVRKKNLAALLRAFAATPDLLARANLVILAGQHHAGRRSVEEAEVLAELHRLAAHPALAGRVALPQSHTTADVHALYGRAARGGVFVNPALHEPFGLTLIEAAAMGVPVVATRHGGPADILHAIGHGILVDPQDAQAIAQACLHILSNPALHATLAAAARQNAASFAWPRYAEQSVALYASLRPPHPALVRPPRRRPASFAPKPPPAAPTPQPAP